MNKKKAGAEEQLPMVRFVSFLTFLFDPFLDLGNWGDVLGLSTHNSSYQKWSFVLVTKVAGRFWITIPVDRTNKLLWIEEGRLPTNKNLWWRVEEVSKLVGFLWWEETCKFGRISSDYSCCNFKISSILLLFPSKEMPFVSFCIIFYRSTTSEFGENTLPPITPDQWLCWSCSQVSPSMLPQT